MRELLNRLKEQDILLEVVDGKLKLFANDTNLDPALIAEVKAKSNELLQFLSNADQSGFNDSYSLHIPATPEAGHYPLSSSQEMLWIVCQHEQSNVGYNIREVYEFEGQLDIAALSSAFNNLLKRHEILRTVFREDEQGVIRQFVRSKEEIDFKIGYWDLRNETDQEAQVSRLLRRSSLMPFDLAEGPLLRADCWQIEDHRYIFSYVMHHIISDGWTMEILLRELLHYYNATLQGGSDDRPPLRIQYRDYVAWLQEQLSGAAKSAHKAYWLQQFQGDLPVLALEGDKPRPPLKTYNGEELSFRIGADTAKGIKALCKAQGATLFMGLLAAVTALLNKFTGQEDIVIGTPIAGRGHADLEDQIGYYVNTLALRMQFSRNNNYRAMLEMAKQVTLGAYEHQLYPFGELVEALHMQRNMSRNPLFDVQVILGQSGMLKAEDNSIAGGLQVRNYEGEQSRTSRFDIVFNFVEAGDELLLGILYNSGIYTHEGITRLGACLEQLMAAIVMSPETTIVLLDCLHANEKQKILTDFNGGQLEYPNNQTVLDLFNRQVLLHPDHPALVFEGESHTYKELDNLSNRLAGYLKKNYAITGNDLIGIMVDRSDKMIIGILGILKSGAAYVPVDPDYPQARKKFIIRDTQIKVLLTQSDYLFDLDYYDGAIFALDIQLDMPDDQLEYSNPDPAHIAYIIYTSGSTGNPKGVLIDHGNLMHSLVSRMEIYPGVRKFLLMSSYAFDSSIAGIFGTLCTGGTLCIIKKTDTANAHWVAEYIVKNGISHLLTVPSLYQVLLSELADTNNALSVVIVAGETCSVQLVNYHYSLSAMQDCVLYNEYGPTEGSVWSSVYKYEKGQQPFLTIGKPIHNTQMYILRDGVSVLPVGLPGEICIGGRGVASGYLNQPYLTAKKFVTNPFKAGERMYRTGDLGKWLPDGNIVFMGRMDDQVKIRGYRVELGEVENALQTHASIDAAIVVARPDKEGNKELAAFVTGPDTLTVPEIKGHLGRILPEHAIPAHFIRLGEFPLTPNGKVDRKKLIEYTGEGISGGTEYIAPRNETEAKLAEVWEEILGKEKIGVRNSFFEMGGDSIKILRMVAAARKKLDLEIPVAEVYKHNTIESILMHVLQHKEYIGVRQEADTTMRAAVIAQMDVLKTRVLSYDHIANRQKIEDVYPMSDIEKGMVYESLLNDGYTIYHDQMVHQRVFPAFDSTRFRLAIQLLVEKHSILRTSFDVSNLEQPVQLVHRTIPVDVHYADLSGTDSTEQEATIRSFLRAELQRPFDTAKAPLWRMAAFNIGENRIVFVSQCHHAIIDGWSDALFMTELNNLYLRLAEEPDYRPVKLRSDYKEFVIRQEIDKMDQSVRTFWKDELAGFKKPELFTSEDFSGRYHFVPDRSMVKKLETRAGKLDTSIKAISLSAFLYLLQVLSYNEEIVVGVVTNTRPDCEDGDKVLGCFLNTIPLRMEISSDEKCTSLTRRVYNKLIALKDKERLSLLEIARLHTKGTGNPFFDVIFNYVDFHAYNEIENKLPNGYGQQVAGIEIAGKGVTNTFLDLTVNMTGGRFSVGITMGKKMKGGFTPEQIGGLYMTILSFLTDPADRALHTIELVGEVEKQQLLTAFNPVPVKMPDGPATIVELFEEKVARTPDRVALAYRNTTMTYRELNEQSNQLAHHLRTTCHILPDDLIGIKLERSERLIITILAILKSGGAYLPVDPGNPPERIDYMIKDSGCQLFIDENWLNDYDQFQKAEGLNDPIQVNQPNNLAYVIYTSGSTGKPKGVLVEHRSVVNLIVAQRAAFGISEEDNVLQASDVSFDASVEQIFIALTSGARLTMIDKAVLLEPEKLEAFIDDHQITHVHLVPGILAMLPVKKYTYLKRVIAGGDTCPKDLAERWSAHHPFYNEYGPTETTVTSIMHLYDPNNEQQSF
ncbi:MAG: amino acid adenylation domain-containing protein, partial [Niastella sp.]|uniref:amino acid adenylation domain-containing protein n=1 Tax=Niastella sp. TaxID=1869183 RepID=UPI00389B17DE